MTTAGPRPGATLVALSSALAVLAACGANRSVAACTTDADCDAHSYCSAGSCRASAAPLAGFSLPGSAQAARLQQIVASAADPDADDWIAGYAWTVEAVAGGCPADPPASDAPILEVVFWCPGTYEVTLVATDSFGVASAPVTRSLVVAPGEGLPSVAAGPGVQVGHRCAGTPLRCELEQGVELTATGTDPEGQPLEYRWAAVPPSASRAAAVARFDPSPELAAVTAGLETDGGPISGEWIFRVRVRDPDGNLGQATVAVSVGNRPPAVDGTPVVIDHRYEGGAYLADGPLSATVTDPDGDPVSASWSYQEPADTGCQASVEAASGRLGLSCPTPAALVGRAARTLRVSATDVNGAGAEAGLSLEIRNRPPVVRPAASAAATELWLPHAVGACPHAAGSCFQAAGTHPFVASDPDGDPISDVALEVVVAPGRPSSVAELVPGAPPGFRFSTPVAAPAEFRAADGATGFTVRGVASDPFGPSPAAELAIRIENRPPVVRSRLDAAPAPHRYDPAAGAYLATADLSIFEDPDGDPISAAASVGDAACRQFDVVAGTVRATCRLSYALTAGGVPPLASLLGDHLVVARASDGWDRAEAATTLTIANRPVTASSFSGPVEACTCACTRLSPDGTTCVGAWRSEVDRSGVWVPAVAADADGDPLRMEVTPADATVLSPAATVLPGGSTVVLANPSPSQVYWVSLTDGAATAAAAVTVTGVTCAVAGQACEPW